MCAEAVTKKQIKKKNVKVQKLCPARIRDFHKFENQKVQEMASDTRFWSQTQNFLMNRPVRIQLEGSRRPQTTYMSKTGK